MHSALKPVLRAAEGAHLHSLWPKDERKWMANLPSRARLFGSHEKLRSNFAREVVVPISCTAVGTPKRIALPYEARNKQAGRALVNRSRRADLIDDPEVHDSDPI